MAKMSIVVPVYYNAENLPTTVPALLELQDIPDELELVFVDDGSGDASYQLLRDFQAKHPKQIVVVRLTRNFGSMSAIQAGLSQATGDCVGVISADLQDPPELFRDMYAQWKKGTKAIYAVRQERGDRWFDRLYAGAFYGLLRKMALSQFPRGGFDFFLLDREVVNQINQIDEAHTNIMALIVWLGYPSTLIPYVRQSRDKGVSRWTLSKKIKFAIDSFVSFSYLPVRLMSFVGAFYAVMAFLYSFYLIYVKLVHDQAVQGWTALMVFLAFTSGLILIMLGVLGEYLWRISDTVKRRPNYVIDEVNHGP